MHWTAAMTMTVTAAPSSQAVKVLAVLAAGGGVRWNIARMGAARAVPTLAAVVEGQGGRLTRWGMSQSIKGMNSRLLGGMFKTEVQPC